MADNAKESSVIYPFDTLKLVNKLKSGGFTQEQAETQAATQVEILAHLIDNKLATKEDIKDLRGDMKDLKKDLKGDMKDLNTKIDQTALLLRGEMKDLKQDLLIKLSGVFIAGFTVLGIIMNYIVQ